MSDLADELGTVLKHLEEARGEAEAGAESLREGLEKLEGPLKSVSAAWSGSDIGYHARLYYENFETPPLHRSFDVEWGGLHGLEGWMEVDVDQIAEVVEHGAGLELSALDREADDLVSGCKALATEVVVALSPLSARDDLPRERELLDQLENFQWGTAGSVRFGGGYRITRDSRAMSEGIKAPPHRVYAARVSTTSSKLAAVTSFFDLAIRAVRQVIRVLETEGESSSASAQLAEDSLTPVLNLCRRFGLVARQLARRQQKRDAFPTADEYDVQDLLHSLLWIHFEDVRAEEWTPSYAGGSSRMDFLLKRENVVVEVKRTRDGLADKQLGEELTIDAARYAEHPGCEVLVCFVYDPDRRVGNPRGLEDDLARLSSERVQVVAVICQD